MTHDEYRALRRKQLQKIAEAKDIYKKAIQSFQTERDAVIAECQQAIVKAKQACCATAPYQPGDIVLAIHTRGNNFRRATKCKVTRVDISDWLKENFVYEGVTLKKNGSFSAQEAWLRDVRPFTEGSE